MNWKWHRHALKLEGGRVHPLPDWNSPLLYPTPHPPPSILSFSSLLPLHTTKRTRLLSRYFLKKRLLHFLPPFKDPLFWDGRGGGGGRGGVTCFCPLERPPSPKKSWLSIKARVRIFPPSLLLVGHLPPQLFFCVFFFLRRKGGGLAGWGVKGDLARFVETGACFFFFPEERGGKKFLPGLFLTPHRERWSKQDLGVP